MMPFNWIESREWKRTHFCVRLISTYKHWAMHTFLFVNQYSRSVIDHCLLGNSFNLNELRCAYQSIRLQFVNCRDLNRWNEIKCGISTFESGIAYHFCCSWPKYSIVLLWLFVIIYCTRQMAKANVLRKFIFIADLFQILQTVCLIAWNFGVDFISKKRYRLHSFNTHTHTPHCSSRPKNGWLLDLLQSKQVSAAVSVCPHFQ